MINFKEQNGLLFKMLDKPTPLTPEAEMPCLVRLIQDDSPMGRHNKFAFSPLMKNNNPIIIDSIKENAVSIAFNRMVFHYSNFEIIGTPVKEGSAEWALYHAINGETVTMDDCGIYKIQDGKLWECFPNDSNEWRVVADDGYGYWLEYIHDNTGWQIYKEPKQPKPKYRVGDSVICEYHRSPLPKQVSYERIIDINDVTIVTQSQNGSVCEYDINGNHGDINGWHIDRVISPSEHIITIGCLSGTVEDLSYEENGKFWLIGKATERHPIDMYVLLYDEMLDAPTSNLVESLLKAQIKENA